MTQEEKQLLLKDLCARQLYGVKFKTNYESEPIRLHHIIGENIYTIQYNSLPYWIEDIKPYLRPMSSMTEEEFKEYHSMLIDVDNSGLMNQKLITKIVDWLDEKMFDHRNLVPKRLALEAKEGMYKTE